MNLIVVPVILLQLALAEQDPLPPPNSEHIARISKLIRETEGRDIELKARIEKLQQKLQQAYADFELDQEHIGQLQIQIVTSQNKLLVNYNRLQVGYREIMGRERFRQIKLRIDNYIETAEERRKKQEETTDKPSPQSE